MKIARFSTFGQIFILYFGSACSKALESLWKHDFRNVTAKIFELFSKIKYV